MTKPRELLELLSEGQLSVVSWQLAVGSSQLPTNLQLTTDHCQLTTDQSDISRMRNDPSTDEIIQYLHATMGKVSLAAEQLQCAPETIYRLARSSPQVASVLRLYRGKLLDSAEAALWRAVLEGESWAVKWALEQWGQSRNFSDGAEIWHAPAEADEEVSHELVRALAEEILKHGVYTEARRTGQLDSDARALCSESERGPLADGAAPGGDR
jgi:hypothetical protein